MKLLLEMEYGTFLEIQPFQIESLIKGNIYSKKGYGDEAEYFLENTEEIKIVLIKDSRVKDPNLLVSNTIKGLTQKNFDLIAENDVLRSTVEDLEDTIKDLENRLKGFEGNINSLV